MTTQAQIEVDARAIVNCLMSAPDPLPLVSACAVAGNAWQENLCRPITTGPKDHGSDGMMQWRLSRLIELQQRARWDTLPVQCQFFKDECKRDYPGLWAQLVAGSRSLETLTLNITDQYERPSAAGRVPDLRIGYARHVQRLFAGQPVPVPAPARKPNLFVIGDSIALGTAQALGCSCHAIEGASYATIATWEVPNVDTLIVSMGTNPGGKGPNALAAVRPALQTVANKASAAGVRQIIWIAPNYYPPLLSQERQIVQSFARSRDDPCVAFIAGADGIHPRSYAALANDVRSMITPIQAPIPAPVPAPGQTPAPIPVPMQVPRGLLVAIAWLLSNIFAGKGSTLLGLFGILFAFYPPVSPDKWVILILSLALIFLVGGKDHAPASEAEPAEIPEPEILPPPEPEPEPDMDPLLLIRVFETVVPLLEKVAPLLEQFGPTLNQINQTLSGHDKTLQELQGTIESQAQAGATANSKLSEFIDRLNMLVPPQHS